MRQIDMLLVIKGRAVVRVAAPVPKEPERLHGLPKPVSARLGQRRR